VGDYLVVKKLSAAGALLWQVAHDPAARLRGVWIAVDGGGNPVVLARVITGSSANPSGWLTLKYDTNGALLWTQSLAGPFADPRRVAIDASDDIYVAGRMFLTNPSGYTTLDSVLIKYSPDGTTQWSAAFDNNGAVDEPYSLAVSPDGTRIGVAGLSGNLFMALMYAPNGTRVWAKTSNSLYPANDVAFGVGNVSYFGTGTYSPQDPNPYQMAIVKFDAAGNQSWLRSYAVGDRTFRVAVDSHGNVVAAGMDAPGYYQDWMTIKTDASGNLLWSRKYDGGGNNHETVNMLALDASDNVYVTGTGGPFPVTGTVSWLKGVVAKYAADGTPQWAVWDPYVNGKALVLGEGSTLTTLSFGSLILTHYLETGQTDVPPAAPTNLAARADLSRIDLTFEDNANNELFVEVERCSGAGCTNFSKIGQTLGENSTGFRDQNIVAGATYAYRVRARGFAGPSAYSNTVTILAPGTPSVPPAPTWLYAWANGRSEIRLSWNNNTTQQDMVKVERCRGVGCTNFAQIATVAGLAMTYTDSGLTAGTTYVYRVRAHSPAGDSPYSETASAKTAR
jgi:hypothetical protein